jgi:hypothetical protein
MIGSNVAATRGLAAGSCRAVTDMSASRFLLGQAVVDHVVVGDGVAVRWLIRT